MAISDPLKLATEHRSLVTRPRRLRQSEALRSMVRETELKPSDFILPFFVVEGKRARNEVPSMPGVFQGMHGLYNVP